MKISIIMCVLNSMPYIMASIESFRRQKNVFKELIIIYSNSDDQTEYYLRSLKDKNIKKFKFNGNVYQCLNFGIKKSTGKVIGVLHSDDIFFSPNTLNNIKQTFISKKVDLIYGNVLYSEKNNLLNITRIWENIKVNNSYNLPPHTGTFIKKKILKKINYNINYKISSDTDLLIRLFRSKIKFMYLKKYICIMRSGGLSTSGKSFLTKIFEDLKIYKIRNLSILDYLKKIIFKINQFLFSKHIKLTSYHRDINAHSKVKFIKPNQILEKKGKVISALNLAYIAYNYKYNLRQHNHVYWPDGIFSTFATNKIKEPSRIYFIKLITHLNKNNKYKLHIFGNIPDTTHHWLNKKLNTSYIHHKLPYGNIKKIIKSVNGIKLKKNKIIILTLPTPKQEQLANFFSKKFPANNLICIGGGLNILSGYEEKAPKFFYDLNLEWLWRLRFDSYRRCKRLLESVILYLNLVIRGKNNIF